MRAVYLCNLMAVRCFVLLFLRLTFTKLQKLILSGLYAAWPTCRLLELKGRDALVIQLVCVTTEVTDYKAQESFTQLSDHSETSA